MNKEKFHIEYVFDTVSVKSLWNQLTTPPGLAAWFADSVTIKGDTYHFVWHKEGEDAYVIDTVPEESIRFRWKEDEDESSYFEFKIHVLELTNITTLEITDFAEPDEKADSIQLWDSQVEILKRTLGI